jgi:hypothetical protein
MFNLPQTFARTRPGLPSSQKATSDLLPTKPRQECRGFFLAQTSPPIAAQAHLFLNRPERRAFNSGSFVMFAAIRRASSPKVLEIKYGRWGFQQE